jgi:vitamin B12 transporter
MPEKQMISPTIYFKHPQKFILCKQHPASAVFLLCLSTVAIADKAPPLGNGTIPLAPMTVYGDRTDPELIDPPQMRNQLGRDSLQAAEMPDLNSVLKKQSGLTLTQGTGQIPTKISLRGSSGGQGLITLDGVPLFGNIAGYYSLSHYPLDALDQVTVTRGSGGERHGSRTLGGAIHLQTRHMQQKDSFLRIEGGSYDTVRGAVGTGLTTKAGDFSAVVGRSDIFNGISQAQNGTERDNFGMTHASANWAKEFSRGALDASVYFVRTDEDSDGPGFLPSGRIGWVDDKLARFSDETWVAQLRGQYALTSYWNSSLQFGFTQDRQKGVATLIKPSSITSQLYLLDWKNTHRLPLSTDNQDQALLVWGIRHYWSGGSTLNSNR